MSVDDDFYELFFGKLPKEAKYYYYVKTNNSKSYYLVDGRKVRKDEIPIDTINQISELNKNYQIYSQVIKREDELAKHKSRLETLEIQLSDINSKKEKLDYVDVEHIKPDDSEYYYYKIINKRKHFYKYIDYKYASKPGCKPSEKRTTDVPDKLVESIQPFNINYTVISLNAKIKDIMDKIIKNKRQVDSTNEIIEDAKTKLDDNFTRSDYIKIQKTMRNLSEEFKLNT